MKSTVVFEGICIDLFLTSPYEVNSFFLIVFKMTWIIFFPRSSSHTSLTLPKNVCVNTFKGMFI